MGDGDIKFLLTMDANGALKVMREFDESLDHTAKTSDKTEKAHKSMVGAFALGSIAADAARKTYNLITGELDASVKAAVNAAETHSKFGVVFSDVADKAGSAAADLADNWGLSKQASEAMLSSTGDLLTGLGLTRGSALDLSIQTQKLAIDLASFTNYSGGAQGASEALTKAMLGERESIKSLGIVITEEMVKEELAKRGKSELTGMALYQAKAEATLAIAMAQSKNAIGDYARTQDSTANSMKRVTALMDDMRVAAGNAILQTIGPAIVNMKKWMEENGETATRTLGSIIRGFKTAGEIVVDAGRLIVGAFEDILAALGPVDRAVRIAMDGWRKIMVLVTDELGATYDKLGESIQRSNEQSMTSIQRFRETAKAVGASGEQIRELSRKYKDVDDAGIKHEKMLRELIKLYPDAAKKLQEKAKAHDKEKKSVDDVTGATKKQEKASAAILNQLRWIKDESEDLGKVNTNILEPSVEGVVGETINMDRAILKTGQDAKKTFSYMASTVAEFWAQYGQSAMDAIYSVDALVMQSIRNKEIALDNAYKKDVERIEKSQMSEEEKATALEKIDQEYDAKRQALKSKQASQDKAMSIIQATISTYEGAAKAFAQGGIFGHIFGAIIIAAGLALVAKIKAQPIPLAKGAIFDKPTLLAGANGSTYEVAEPGSGGTEIVATPANIRKAIGLGKGGGTRPMAPVSITVPISIGREKVEEILIQVIEDASRTGRLRLSAKSIYTR